MWTERQLWIGLADCGAAPAPNPSSRAREMSDYASL